MAKKKSSIPDDPAKRSTPAIETDREVLPVDTEEPPRLAFPVVGIGASAGGLEAFTEFFKVMPADSGMAFVLVQHLPPDRESLIAEILQRQTKMRVQQVEDGMAVKPNHVYCIRPGHTLTIKHGVLHLGQRLERAMHSRPVDDLFRSLAEEQRERAIGIIMSGMGSNGSAGAQMIKAVGGMCIAQDTDTAQYPSMPRHLVDAGHADYILRPAEMPDVLLAYAVHPYARGGREQALQLVARDEQYLAEILAVLKARTRHDFSGYKKPTLVRRVQRRMGLSRIETFGDYTKILRQSPAEVASLADDVLIHVTGFFRDPDAWETLRTSVIVPLIAMRENDASIRCWVTACSTGEEAYTLAMLLAEEAERVGKRLDIKVFATDMAERALANARLGVFPGGIESEITPTRLARYFQRDDAVYRVRQELREYVTFAPQNVLQDPPFSRLDIVSCRNLLIYLEPEVQQRLLNLLHFGLREGGTLFLGTSETTGGMADLFETIDKKARLFRRIGPTRHGAVAFPLPHAIQGGGTNGGGRGQGEQRGSSPRLSMSQQTTRALLEHHTPAAVTIDRDGKIVFFHGKTDAFLEQPRGEPTRELLAMVRDSLRGSVRLAIQRATQQAAPVTVMDGWIEVESGRRARIAVMASPLDAKNLDYVVVSFQERGEEPERESEKASPDGSESGHSNGNGSAATQTDELNRVRHELQSTIEELQTSNEELKASHEEVVSVNEELQSTNEELETSREEMQSLNEELSTVNAQLHAKMEEHQAASNDLSSLLTSTDIAVLFLDTRFNIRRFTPAMKAMLDLIGADVGRPLSDLARKFEDPQLVADSQQVLERLIPAEREISGLLGRWYLRRITPYRTADQRIDGVVVTFLDITARRLAEAAATKMEGRFRALVEASSYVVFRMNPDWTEMRELHGRDFIASTEVPTRSWLQTYVHPEDQARVMDRVAEGVRDKKIFEVEYRMRGRDGSMRWTLSRALPVLGPAGEIIEWFGAASDITGRMRADAALHKNEQRLQRVVAIDTVGIVFFDNDGRITECNDAFLRIAGFTREECRKRTLTWESLKPAGGRAGTAMKMSDDFTQVGHETPYERQYVRRDGTKWWGLFAGQRLDENSIVEYVIDVTVRREAERSQQASEEHLRLVADAARLGFWDWDITTGVVTREETANQLIGLPSGETSGTYDELINRVHPEDRDRVAKTHQEAIDKKIGFSEEFRVVVPDGSVHWLSGYGRPIFDSTGQVVRMIGGALDISERKYTDEERAELLKREQTARAEAEAANVLKDQFLATLSHELRTPLSAILLWSKILRDKNVTPERLEEGLGSIATSAEAQKQLIEDLLDVSRMSEGKMRLKVEETDLAPVLHDAVEAVLPAAEAKGVEMTTAFGKDIGRVMVDPDRIRQVVWNLLANSVKFTAAGGKIEVRLSRRDGQVEIAVADTGRGIKADFLPHVFDRFRQADSTSTRTQSGLGLGLAISKQLVELHGGTIEAASEGEKQGATFIVRLPLPRVRRSRTIREAATPLTGLSKPHMLGGMKVLLVEDEAETRNALVALLESGGAVVTAVDSSQAAWAAIETSQPTVLLSDLGLADEDGISLVRRLRKREKTKQLERLPAIALTAFVQLADKKAAMSVGFDLHLEKPVDPVELLAALQKMTKVKE